MTIGTIDVYALAAGISALLLLVVLALSRASIRREQQARVAAERASAHAASLAQLASIFARVRSSDEALELAMHEPLAAVRGRTAIAATVQGGVATIVRAAGYDELPGPDLAASLLPRAVLRECIRSREPIVIASRDQARHAECWREDGPPFTPIAFIPFMLRRQLTALVRVDFPEGHEFTTEDYETLAFVGDHARRALARTRDHEEDQRARIEAETLRARADEELGRRQVIEQALRASETRYRALATRTTRLHGFTAALSEAVTTDAVASAIVQQATVVVGATMAEVLTEAALDSEAGSCEAEAVATRKPVFVPSWADAQEHFWRSASRAADGGYVSSVALPLTIDGAVIGVLRFDFSVPVNFDDDYRTLLVSVAQHCTQALDRARLYESAQRARSEAEAASRLKDEFLSIVSHELRTPLNAVLGWSSMLQKTGIDGVLAHRAARSIQENATRQAQLIDDLLDVSRIAAGSATFDMQDIQSGDVVSAVVESLTPLAAEKAIELSFSCPESAGVRGDRRRLEQVFFNIIGNALKFTPKGGRVDVVAQIVDGSVDVSVTDTGIGIDAGFLPHVFDRFRQADSTTTRAYGGLGLGLAIARQLVTAHGGEIDVSSAGPGQGTTFVVRLPVLTAEARRRPAAPAAAQPMAATLEWPRLDGVRVLVVDDEAAAREIMASALGECGAVVASAPSAATGFDLLNMQTFDVLLADIAMPGEDGCSLMRRIRACGASRIASLPAVAVTAHAREDERREVLQAGFQRHLVKPIEPRDLAQAVRELVEAGPAFISSMSPSSCP